MAYRNKTYIAADWTADKDAVDQLHKWNDSNYWGLDFYDAHDGTSSRDSSLNCTIKRSLDTRLNNSKTFVLIVGEHTKRLIAGKCFDSCSNYSICSYGQTKKNFSFVQFECDNEKISAWNYYPV